MCGRPELSLTEEADDDETDEGARDRGEEHDVDAAGEPFDDGGVDRGREAADLLG
jgi:hypothetical protein